MPNILVVDDEPEIAVTLMDYLTSCGHTVSTCANAQDGLAELTKKDIQLVLSDIKMPKMDGVDFFKEYKSTGKTNTRFVLMTGHADLMNVQKAYSLGVDELLAKPFDLDILKLVVDYLLETKEAFGSPDEKYFSIPIEDFISLNHQDCSLFLKINNQYMCVTKTGQEFTTQRLQNLSQKGVKSVYLNSADYAKYADLQFVTADRNKLRPVDKAKKVKASSHLVLMTASNPLLKLIDKNNATRALKAFNNYAQAVFNHNDLSNLFVDYMKAKPDSAKKSCLVAVLSSCIADQWKWSSPRIQSRIVLGGLLCDIGLKDCKEAYEEHPTLSHSLLKGIDQIPEEILNIALQHHENTLGQGFPNKLARSKVHSFAKLVHGVNEFIDVLYAASPEKIDKAQIKATLDQISASPLKKTISEQVLKSIYVMFEIPCSKDLEGVLLPDQTNRVL